MAHTFPSHPLKPEERILLASLKLSWNEDEKVELAQTISAVDHWDYFCERAVDTYLGTTVYVRLVKQLKLGFPAHVLKVLDSMYFQVLVKNTQLVAAYEEISEKCYELGLPHIPLKGIHFLKQSFANDIGIRQLSDIDVLFQSEDAQKVHNSLLSLGYRSYLTMPIRISKLLKNPTPYNYSKNGITLDVHYALNRLESFNISITEVWKSAVKSESTFECHLSIEDQLIHLCTHAFLHMKIYDLKQISFLDIITLLSNEELNWKVFQTKVEQYRCEEETASMLFLINRYFESEIPESIMELLKEEQRKELIEKFLLLLQEDKTKLKATHYKMKDRYFQFFHLLSWKGRLLFVAFYVFPDEPYLRQLYGSQSNRFFLWLKHMKSIIKR
jgi:hypothetical protein